MDLYYAFSLTMSLKLINCFVSVYFPYFIVPTLGPLTFNDQVLTLNGFFLSVVPFLVKNNTIKYL